ncbi:apolipoprotein N-acyltransferase [Amphritea sp. HPY]|uniref:apolipoprotein N-acyltransferase n=1 Tax=Amphritea sp. HPY TaxID=3421652 RepID=UPI003D7F111F
MADSTQFILLRVLLALTAGAIAPLALAPFDYWYLSAISVALLFFTLQGCTPKASGWLGWCYGLGFFGVGISWVFVSIHEHGNAPTLLAGSLTGLFVAAMAILMVIQCWLYRRLFYNVLGFIALWLLFEWLRSWLLTGFPWLYLGYALLDTPLAQYAPFGGVWLLSLYVVLSGTLLITIIKRWQHPLQAFAMIAIIIIPWFAAEKGKIPTDLTREQGDEVSVMMVQANIPQQLKWQRSELDGIMQKYVDLSQDSGKVDLLIWPETAIPTFYRNASTMLSPLMEYLQQNNTGMISGIPSVYPDPTKPRNIGYHNSLSVFAGGSGSYHKQRLVPFGEYVPLEQQLRGLIDFFNLPMSNFSLGPENQPPLEVNGLKIAPYICYEIAYPELVRQSSLTSDLLLTVSNDTWFGHSIAPAQHLQIARMRALETGRWLIRSTNNGISALISPRGEITSTIPQFEQAVLIGNVKRMEGLTPYQQYGVKPLQVAVVVMLFFALITRPRANRRRTYQTS